MLKKILFLVNYPKEDNLRDGYYQRVKGVDCFFKDFKRVYVEYYKESFSYSFFLKPRIREIKKNVSELRVNKRNPFHLIYVIFFVFSIGRVYFHSTYRLNSFFHKLLYLLARKRVIDLHGIVSEEVKMTNKGIENEKFKKDEKFALKYASSIICVTEKMADYVKDNYKTKGTFFILPVLHNIKKINERAKFFQGNTVIYSGGLQKWQQVDKMLEFVFENRNKIKFIFLVTSPNEIKEKYKNKFKEDFPGKVARVDFSEVEKYYEKNSFGLILRKDNIVNQVAFPTKLIEYIENGIVPIVDSPNIGDFSQKNFSYVYYKDELPEETEWKAIVTKNISLLGKIHRESKKDIKKIVAWLK